MTAAERAEQCVVEHFADPDRDTLTVAVMRAIRAAENEAIERAAIALDVAVQVERHRGRADVLVIAAEIVRGAKSEPR